jgi:redox-sensitive bicupin YhaK (pirin superfamily)
MIEIRPYKSLGGGNHGWLNTRHHFSFADYQDEERMNWGALRVWNDDEIASGAGFPAHPHANMEIITYVRQGAITHGDSLGNKGRTEAGDVQVMSAGSGIRHAEYNLEPDPTRIFQIWIIPNTRGGAPEWGAKAFPKCDRAGKFVVLASGIAGDTDALPIRSDSRVIGVTLQAGQTAEYRLGTDRHLYLVPATGLVEVNGARVRARDGVAVSEEERLSLMAIEDSEIVMVDAP